MAVSLYGASLKKVFRHALIHVYPKSRQENLTPHDAKILGRLAAILRDEVMARLSRSRRKEQKDDTQEK